MCPPDWPNFFDDEVHEPPQSPRGRNYDFKRVGAHSRLSPCSSAYRADIPIGYGYYARIAWASHLWSLGVGETSYR